MRDSLAKYKGQVARSKDKCASCMLQTMLSKFWYANYKMQIQVAKCMLQDASFEIQVAKDKFQDVAKWNLIWAKYQNLVWLWKGKFCG